MGIQRTFGKLGNRGMARLRAGLQAGLVTPDRTARCIVEDVSRKGCRLLLPEPPRVGATTLVRIAEFEILGTIAWVKGQTCGVTFARALEVDAVERFRWIVEHAREHEIATLENASDVWR
jgi:PilZ domain